MYANKRLALLFIFVTVTVDAIGIGIIIPVMPDLLIDVSGATLADAAIWGGFLASVFAVMQMLCGPFVGSLSDRYGRRPVLLLSLLFMALDYLLLGIAHTMFLLFVARIIGGITSSTYATAAAFIADISSPEEKTQNFGLVGAAIGVGFVLGPAFGAFFAEFGTRVPFFAAAIISFCNMLLGLAVLPETVTEAQRRPFEWRRANPLGGLRSIASLPGLRGLLIVLFVTQVAYIVYPSVWSFYTVERFDWMPRMIGLSLAAYGITVIIGQGVLIRWVVRYVGNFQLVVTALVFELLMCLGFGFAWEGWMVFALLPLSVIGGMAMPTLQSIMSQAVYANQQGELQGVILAIGSASAILSPLIMTQIFNGFVQSEFLPYLPGAPFLAAFLLLAASTALFVAQNRSSA